MAFVAAVGVQPVAAGQISEDIPVPGGTAALSRAIGLETPPEPSRFLAEIARLAYGVSEARRDDASSLSRRLAEHLDAVSRFRAALEALPNASPTLALASQDKDRDRLTDFLELVNLRLKESRGTYSVEPANDRAAASRVQMLGALGIDLEHLADRLNAGETVGLSVPAEMVPVPLTAALWSEVVFRRTVPERDLFAAILAESNTAMLGHGLAALDDETLAYLAEHHAELTRLSGDVAPVFATFASNLHVRAGRVVTPGGAVAVPLWEAVVDEKVNEPDAFIRALFSRDRGHLAYLYDLIAELDAPRAAFALGLRIQNDRDRIERFKSFVSTVHSSLAEWEVRTAPFNRPLHDVGWMLLNVAVERDGTPRGPAALGLWLRVFDGLDLPSESARRALDKLNTDVAVDAAWLANAILTGDPPQRAQRLQQLAFGFRAFAAARPATFGDVLTAVRALPSYTALMLTLERMSIADPAVYATAARAAERLSGLEGGSAFVAMNQFQGAIALLARMSAAGSVEPVRAGALVTSLSTIPLQDGRYGARIVQWLRGELLPVMVPRSDPEGTVLAALAGATASGTQRTERVSWEGEQYRLDLQAAEERRLLAVRQQQRGYSLETALNLEQVTRSLDSDAIDLPGIQRAVGTLRALLPAFPPSSTVARAVRPEGVADLPDAAGIVDRAVKDLSKITKPSDAKKAKRLAEPLSDLSGVILGEALTSIAYAISLGDATDNPLLGGDLPRRHDFGLALRDQAVKKREAWAIPRQLVIPGQPRRVSGSLMALDVAFARLVLRRAALEEAGPTPVLLSNDRETFTRSVALLNPYSMRDADRDAIAAALSRGRARIEAVAAGSGAPGSLDVIASEIKLDGWRRRAAQWDVAHEPRRLPALFSLTELLVLGGGEVERLDGWGMAGTPLSGCLCTRFGAPNEWRLVSGRPQLGALSTAVADLNLHVAAMLSTLRLPAPLARLILGAAMQEYVDRVRPNDGNDWLTLVQGASAISRERIEDYTAAATADGPLLLERSNQQEQQA